MPDDTRPADDARPVDDTRPADGADPAGTGAAGEVELPDARPMFSPPPTEVLGIAPSEFARQALNRAKAAARARGAHPGKPAPSRPPGSTRAGSPRVGDGRDPVLLGDTLSRIAAERGWDEPLSVGGVVGRWSEVVGPEVAEHCKPETFEDGLLVVRADSTTWATNLRLLAPQLLARLAAEVGPDVVTDVKVLGPAGPRWAKGKRSVPGRGPRDTYG